MISILDLSPDRFQVVAIKHLTPGAWDTWEYFVARELLDYAEERGTIWKFHARDEFGRQVIKARMRRGK